VGEHVQADGQEEHFVLTLGGYAAGDLQVSGYQLVSHAD
jgi:hypothetical protein